MKTIKKNNDNIPKIFLSLKTFTLLLLLQDTYKSIVARVKINISFAIKFENFFSPSKINRGLDIISKARKIKKSL